MALSVSSESNHMDCRFTASLHLLATVYKPPSSNKKDLEAAVASAIALADVLLEKLKYVR